MHWYDGNIAEAVNLSKQRNAIFVVFVEDETDEQSVEMAGTIDSASVLKLLSDQNNFLAIKLKSGSTNYTHFARIYQFVPVPSLFFIGHNGAPLEVVCAGIAPDNLASRITRILEEHRRELPAAKPSTSSETVQEQSAKLLKNEAVVTAPVTIADRFKPHENLAGQSTSFSVSGSSAGPDPTTAGGESPICVGDVCTRKPTNREVGSSKELPSSENRTVQQPDTSAEEAEKLKRAKQLIEMKRKEKAEKEKELERLKELERRTAGQGVAELKKWQQDQELKLLHEERKREKMENNLARQKILEQIAQDRAERRARDNPVIPEVNKPRDNLVPEVRMQTQNTETNTSGDASLRARIQFKLPDGSSHTAHFDAEDRVTDVATYLTRQLNLTNFTLWVAFPRREITEDPSTLRGLKLVPSAALLVLSRSQAVSAAPTGLATWMTFITQLFFSMVLTPAQNLLAWFRRPPARPSDTPGPTPLRPIPPRIGLTPPRRGNVHRLRDDRDDDNNTWNGNSTQQM